MRLLRGILLAVGLLLLLVVVAPFTAPGTRLLLAMLPETLPLTLQYRSGALMGTLELERLELATGGLEVDASNWRSTLDPRCLWRSELCLPELRIDELRVAWPGGCWQQQHLRASLKASANEVRVASATIARATLSLAAGEDATAQPGTSITLPELAAPLPLVLESLVLPDLTVEQAGAAPLEMAITLGGEWRGHSVDLHRLDLSVADLVRVQTTARVQMTADWPVQLSASSRLGSADLLPASLHGREFTLQGQGDLSRLRASLVLEGELPAEMDLEVDALQASLPFSLQARLGPWDADALGALPDWPADIPPPALREALVIDAGGDLDRQTLSLATTLGLPGYQALRVSARALHQEGQLDLQSLELADSDTDSRLALSGQLSYGEQGLAWDARLNADSLRLPDYTDRLSGKLEGQLQTAGHWRGDDWSVELREADLSGTINGQPALLSGGLSLDSEQGLIGGELLLEASGAYLSVMPSDGAEAEFQLALPDLSRWHPEARGELSLQGVVRRGFVELDLQGSASRLRWRDLALQAAQLDASLQLRGAGSQQGRLLLTAPEVAGYQLEQLELQLSGDLDSPRLAIASRGALEGELRLQGDRQDDHWRLSLHTAGLDTPLGPLVVDSPVVLDWREDAGRLQAHCWRLPALELCSQPWTLAGSGGGSARLQGDLEVLEPLLPSSLGLTGPISGSLELSWEGGGQPPILQLALDSSGGQVTQWLAEGESASWSWQQFSVRATHDSDGLQVAASLQQGEQTLLDASLQASLSGDFPIQGQLQLRELDMAALQPFLGRLSDLEGSLQGKVALSGTLQAPLASGQLRWRDGALQLHGNPTRLDSLSTTVDLAGDQASISGEAQLGGGPLQWQGEITLQPALQARLQVKGEDNRLLYPPGTELLVSPTLDLAWSEGLLSLRGEVDLTDGVLAYEDLPEGGVELSGDVVEVDYAGNVLEDRQAVDLDARLRVRIRDRFRVRGQDVEVRMSGNLRLAQSPGSPLQLFGNLNVLGGELEVYGQRLVIQQGQVAFSGIPGNPELNLRATREIRAEDMVAGVQVSGTLEQPQLQVYTDPVTSETEALSYLARGRGLDAGAGGGDGSALALSLGTGLVNRSGIVRGLNRLPGLSEIEFGTEGADGQTAATVSGYIGERIYLSYGVGLYEPVNVLTARLYLQARLWLEVVSRLESSVDLYYSFEID